jgi:hypothetical protein
MHTEVHGRIEHAQAELTLHGGGVNSSAIVESLWAGLTTLRKLLLARLHADSKSFAVAKREFRRAAEEIEIYSLLVVVAEVEHSRYTNGDLAWIRDWLLQLRFGDKVDPAIVKSMRRYDQQNDGQRRRMFSSFLEQAFPEGRKAPLIIYRLFPRAVRIVTAVAFADALRAREIRAEQISFLPIISDCHHCHGLPLENSETCVECGNPLWKIKWLNATE